VDGRSFPSERHARRDREEPTDELDRHQSDRPQDAGADQDFFHMGDAASCRFWAVALCDVSSRPTEASSRGDQAQETQARMAEIRSEAAAGPFCKFNGLLEADRHKSCKHADNRRKREAATTIKTVKQPDMVATGVRFAALGH
jgi:hypothetical protein